MFLLSCLTTSQSVITFITILLSLIQNLGLLCDPRVLWNSTLKCYNRSLIWESGLKAIWPISTVTPKT